MGNESFSHPHRCYRLICPQCGVLIHECRHEEEDKIPAYARCDECAERKSSGGTISKDVRNAI